MTEGLLTPWCGSTELTKRFMLNKNNCLFKRAKGINSGHICFEKSCSSDLTGKQDTSDNINNFF